MPWVVTGVGGATAIVGGALYLVGTSKISSAVSQCTATANGSEACPSSVEMSGKSGDSLKTAGAGVFWAGLAVTGGGLLWHILEPTGAASSEKPDAPKTSFTPMVGPASRAQASSVPSDASGVESRMPVEHHAGVLRGKEDVGGGLVRVEIAAPAGFATSYYQPGQYISAALASKETYFALAGEPGRPTWEVLVRAAGEVAVALLSLSPGDGVQVSQALGNGFPMADADGRHLFVLATGGGFAAVRPVLHARIRAGLASKTELFLGVPGRGDVPLPQEITRLRAYGVRVLVCCSREIVDEAGFARGYVQDALRRRALADPAEASQAIVFAAGVTSMVEQLRVIARELQLDETDIRTNY